MVAVVAEVALVAVVAVAALPLMLMLAVPALNCPGPMEPLKLLAVVAKMANGTGVSCWRGVKGMKLLAPVLVSTLISNQLVGPVNGSEPKSICTVNRPLLTMTPLLVTGPAMGEPPVLVMNSEDDQIVPFADSGPLAAQLLKNGTLKVYKDLPHGMPTTHAEIINADLLAFIQA